MRNIVVLSLLVAMLGLPSCESAAPTEGETADVSILADATQVTHEDAFVPGDQGTSPNTPTGGGFEAPCSENSDCFSGFCVEGLEGHICTKICEEECPTGYDCRAVGTETDVIFVCLPEVEKVCTPCAADFECGAGKCLVIDSENRCSYACESDEDCPGEGYVCAGAPGVDDPEVRWCLPATGSCWCTTETAGTPRTCTESNEHGTCYGVETCDPIEGWVGCNATLPAEDTCNGLDDDCDALVDEGILDGGPCENTVEGVGTCAGVLLCNGNEGYACQAPFPEVETCDFADNDCDGQTDEDFTDADGVFSLDEDCGTCGNQCSDKFEHGTGVCGSNPAAPVCVVESCDADYIKLNDFQCVLPPDVSCQPCLKDAACYGGSCVQLDGQQVCVSPCGAEDESCATGYSCEEIEDGVKRCVPDTDSCVCSAETDGQVRTCVFDNEYGKCFGEEVCDGDVGWSGCTASEPAAEVCNGLDDDCNGAVDDAVAIPEEVCEDANEYGTCGGIWFCGASDDGEVAWWCSAIEPNEDVCNYQDDDCDGVADQDFKAPGTDLYVHDGNCGACGISCDGAIPNASATCQPNDGKPRCEVETCAEGYYQAGPLTCLPTQDSLCSPCETDANCANPGDACVPLDGALFCGRDCGEGNVYGVPPGTCPPGFQCTEVGEGGDQCVPVSASCDCLPEDVGKARVCTEENASGICFGSETCDPEVGWIGCSADTPAQEICDGVDNNCNALVDDVPGRGDPCSNSNAFGSCGGVMDCVADSEDLVCVAAEPAEEICDYQDNDCDGGVDETYGTLYDSCSVGEGLCTRFGFQVCTADGEGVTCNVDAGEPKAEQCNGLDDDCDGEADEAWPELGDVCFEGEGVCQGAGVHICSENGKGTTCTAEPNPPGEEICNGVDDDCDGKVDEPWLDPFVGTYHSDDACGSCYTDCTEIFDEDHAYGVCSLVGGETTCEMMCNDGFFDMNGVPDDGCEFEWDSDAVYVSGTDDLASDDGSCGVGPVQTGDGNHPCKTIAQGIERAIALGKSRVLVAGGSYTEQVTLVSQVDLLGGFHPVNWGRDWEVNLTVLQAPSGPGHRKTVVAQNIKSPTIVQGFDIHGTTATTVGSNSYAVWAKSCDENLQIVDNVVRAGNGAPGAFGTSGSDGDDGTDGAQGVDAQEAGTVAQPSCSITLNGGSGGSRSCGGTNVNGGHGGDAVCAPSSNSQTSAQNGQAGFNNSGGLGVGGTGGWDGATSSAVSGCMICMVPGVSMNGGHATHGEDGASGAAGGACSDQDGGVSGGEWSAGAGNAGKAGSAGGGGGGGGAGGGGEDLSNSNCVDDLGATGGGGGSGACAGTQGLGGSGGGGSFGIFVHGGQAAPVVSGNTIHRGFGGAGGSGGSGGVGGVGGDGAAGGVKQNGNWDFCTGDAGKGGNGGNGGHGGGGGGGCGGVSIGIWASNYGGGNTGYAGGNTVLSGGAGGDGGSGGGSLGASGDDGASGKSAAVHD